jgi:hypothetical protein
MMARLECLEHQVDLSYTLHSWSKATKWANRLCFSCDHTAKMAYDAGRKKAWDRLPSFFRLPGWKELKDMD